MILSYLMIRSFIYIYITILCHTLNLNSPPKKWKWKRPRSGQSTIGDLRLKLAKMEGMPLEDRKIWGKMQSWFRKKGAWNPQNAEDLLIGSTTSKPICLFLEGVPPKYWGLEVWKRIFFTMFIFCFLYRSSSKLLVDNAVCHQSNGGSYQLSMFLEWSGSYSTRGHGFSLPGRVQTWVLKSLLTVEYLQWPKPSETCRSLSCSVSRISTSSRLRPI